jgi:hypothetical protein
MNATAGDLVRYNVSIVKEARGELKRADRA